MNTIKVLLVFHALLFSIATEAQTTLKKVYDENQNIKIISGAIVNSKSDSRVVYRKMTPRQRLSNIEKRKR